MKLIGIDLGTTNSCIAYLDGGTAHVIPNPVGDRTTPSVVGYKEDGSVVVGLAARRQAITNPRATVFGVKRLIGRRHDSDAVRELARTMPYPIVPAPNGDAWVRFGGHDVSPAEISAHVLAHLKAIAEGHLGEPVTRAIVTVPAYFDDAQRQATKNAGRIAGLEIAAILNEPTAAALAYGVHRHGSFSTVAVFDLGGGTFDISILRIEDGVFQVLATSGDTFLGGDDFDRLIIEALLAEFEAQHHVKLENPETLQRLKDAAERAKRELSASPTAEIDLPFVAQGPDGPLSLRRTIERSWLETLVKPLLDRLEEPCRTALADSKLEAGQVDQVLLVGGMTRMPAVERKVVDIFGKPPVKGVNPDEIVAIGAATQSAIMTGDLPDIVLLDVASHSIGVRVAGDRVSTIVKRNATVPTRATKSFTTSRDNQPYLTIEVYQGESPTVAGNLLIGRFELGDLPQAPAGHVRVKVSFTLDVDGIVRVEAVANGQPTSKRILASPGLSASEVETLARESGYRLA